MSFSINFTRTTENQKLKIDFSVLNPKRTYVDFQTRTYSDK